VRNDEVSFALGDYDRRLPLVIDPELVYGSYVGGSSVEAARAIAVNGSGYAHVTGWTLSGDFPVVHAADGINADVFLVKLDPTGRQVVYATYFGGSGDDRANAIALDATGNVYITGMTASTDLPVSSNAVQKEVRGIDAFVAKFGPTGTLLYATYMGGTMAEQGQGIAVNQAGEAYITGYTNSDDYPTTTGGVPNRVRGMRRLSGLCRRVRHPAECERVRADLLHLSERQHLRLRAGDRPGCGRQRARDRLHGV
jgi:hypothetical protein